jgi:hypothetical protein
VNEVDHGQSSFDVPPPDPELARLEPLLGTWTSEGHTRDSVLGPGVPVTSIEEFRWLEGGYFLVSTYDTAFGGEPAQKGVNYWTYDSDTRKFCIIFFSNNGPFSEDGNRYQGTVADGKLTFEGPARFQYNLADDGTIQVNADGTISVAWWLRDENGEWAPWMDNTFTRAPDETPVNRVLAGVAVADVDAALPWYARLFGRPPDALPMEGLAEWHVPSGGVLQLVANRERAGRSLLTLDLPDVAQALAGMRERGLEAGPLDDMTSDKVLIASTTDPEGNAVTLVQQR